MFDPFSHNLLVHSLNIFGSSLDVLSKLQKSSEMFGNFWKMFRNFRMTFGHHLENLRKSLENCQMQLAKDCEDPFTCNGWFIIQK